MYFDVAGVDLGPPQDTKMSILDYMHDVSWFRGTFVVLRTLTSDRQWWDHFSGWCNRLLLPVSGSTGIRFDRTLEWTRSKICELDSGLLEHRPPCFRLCIVDGRDSFVGHPYHFFDTTKRPTHPNSNPKELWPHSWWWAWSGQFLRIVRLSHDAIDSKRLTPPFAPL